MTRTRKALSMAGAAIVLVLIVAAAWVWSMQSRAYDVVVVMGQSNAAGAGKGWQPFGEDSWNPDVYQLGAYGPTKGVILPGVDPLLHPDPDFGAVGFGPTFADHYTAQSDRDVLLVPVAAKSTAFTPGNGYTWDADHEGPETNLFDLAMQQTTEALSQHPESRIVAVLWLQGESDTSKMRGEEYAAHLDGLIGDFRAEFGDVPFLVGQMNPDWIEEEPDTRAAINAVHESTPERVPGTVFVPGPHDAYNDGDPIHYNAAGQRTLGDAFWEAYADLTALEP